MWVRNDFRPFDKLRCPNPIRNEFDGVRNSTVAVQLFACLHTRFVLIRKLKIPLCSHPPRILEKIRHLPRSTTPTSCYIKLHPLDNIWSKVATGNKCTAWSTISLLQLLTVQGVTRWGNPKFWPYTCSMVDFFGQTAFGAGQIRLVTTNQTAPFRLGNARGVV